MLTNIESKQFQELFATSIVQQTAFWSEVKKRLGSTPLAVNFNLRQPDAQLESDILVLLQPLDRHHCMAYVPYGPELEPEESGSSSGP